MDDDLPARILIDVPEGELPRSLRARLVPDAVVTSSDRFRPAPRPSILWPAAWIAILVLVGGASLIATLRAGIDPQTGDQRFVYAGLTGAFLLGASFAGRVLVRAVRQRRGTSRQGCHVVARVGLLLADTAGCTWVPRGLLPAPVDDPSTDTRAGGGGVIFVVTSAAGSLKRWSVPRRVGHELDLWRREGVMPDWGRYHP